MFLFDITIMNQHFIPILIVLSIYIKYYRNLDMSKTQAQNLYLDAVGEHLRHLRAASIDVPDLVLDDWCFHKIRY